MLVALGKDTLVRPLQNWNAKSLILKNKSLEKFPDIDLSIIEVKTPISDYLSIYIMYNETYTFCCIIKRYICYIVICHTLWVNQFLFMWTVDGICHFLFNPFCCYLSDINSVVIYNSSWSTLLTFFSLEDKGFNSPPQELPFL